MQHSENINELSAALAKAQGQMLPAKMDAVNPFLHNKYADLGSVIQSARKPLSDNGLSFSQHPTIEAGRVSINTILMHASGQWIASTIDLPIGEEKGLSLAQSMGKVITYLRRYALSAILGIYADEDTDGNDDRPANGKTNGKPAAAKVAASTASAAASAPTSPSPAPKMSRETAEGMLNSQGKRYGDLEDNALSNMTIGIGKALAKQGLVIADKEMYQQKMDAIAAILYYRERDDEAARNEMGLEPVGYGENN